MQRKIEPEQVKAVLNAQQEQQINKVEYFHFLYEILDRHMPNIYLLRIDVNLNF